MASRARPDAPPVLRLVPRNAATATAPSTAPAPAPGTEPIDEGTLLAGARKGDPKIAAIFCQRVWPQVDRTVRRLLGRHDPDLDDVTQLALIELVGSIGRYRGECSLDTWVQTVASHIVFKHIRRRMTERQIFTDLLADDGAGAPPGPVLHGELRSLSRDLLARIAALLDGMKGDRAWAFVLHDVLGYDLREIADMTKTSVAAAQSRLVRGRRDLHALIAADPALAQLLREVEGAP